MQWGTTLTAATATAPTYRGSGSLSLTVSGSGNPAIGTRELLAGLGAGIVVTYHLWAPQGATVGVAPYVFDGGWTSHLLSAETLQPGWNDIIFTLPATAGLSELGLQVNSGGWRGPLVLDAVTVQPAPALT